MAFTRSILVTSAAAMFATAAWAVIDYNSARSNISYKIQVDGKPTVVTQSYKFSWSVDAGESGLSQKELQVLLELAFKQIRKDILR